MLNTNNYKEILKTAITLYLEKHSDITASYICEHLSITKSTFSEFMSGKRDLSLLNAMKLFHFLGFNLVQKVETEKITYDELILKVEELENLNNSLKQELDTEKLLNSRLLDLMKNSK